MKRITDFFKNLTEDAVICMSLTGLCTLYAILPISLLTYKICHDKIEERKEQKLIQEITQKMSNNGSIFDNLGYNPYSEDFYNAMQGINELPNIQ